MKAIPQYHFLNEKYGKILLVDIVDISEINHYIAIHPTHRLAFYDISFIVSGQEKLSVNQTELQVNSGDIICSTPGEVWSWPNKTGLEGYVLLFEEEFLISFFNDKQFLNKLQYLKHSRSSPLMKIEGELFTKAIGYLEDIKKEMQLGIVSNEHILRALVYLVLSLVEKGVSGDKEGHGMNGALANRHIQAFMKLVDAHYLSAHDVQFYADKLFITTNYLNKVTKDHIGSTAKVYILMKILQEAKNLLRYSSFSVSQISFELNFKEPSYFVRIFQKYVGMTPRQFRDQK
nr:AraC family transcriptional regulator [uncultured Chryseobacterium sp.]